LADVCAPGGIFIGGRAKRIYVRDPDHGIPFLSSSDMLKASFDGVKLISRKQPELNSMILRNGWTLISRSGTIGNVAYVRQDMDGLAGSEHIMRVVPDADRIPPGYLYAFLSSQLGTAICKSGTYGTVVDTISTDYIGSIPIPRLDSDTEQRIRALIERSERLWISAQKQLIRSRAPFSHLLTHSLRSYFPHDRDYVVTRFSQLNDRLGAHYHSSTYRQLETRVRSHSFKELVHLGINPSPVQAARGLPVNVHLKGLAIV
jgi:type I restriction enzyme S subunit